MEYIVKVNKNNKIVLDNFYNANQDYVYLVPMEYINNNNLHKFLNKIVDDFIKEFFDHFSNIYTFEVHFVDALSRKIKIFKSKSELISIIFTLNNNNNLIYNIITNIVFKPNLKIKETNKIYMFVVLIKENILKNNSIFCKVKQKGKNTYLIDLTKYF